MAVREKDVRELKRRMKKDSCTITKVCGCYVNHEKEKVLNFQETFLNLEDTEFFKYLEIAKKVLTGKFGDNILQLGFPAEEQKAGGRQQFLMAVRESKLKNMEIMNAFYDMIIENYDYAGNYLILIFHDVYDVMKRTNDNNKLDESEEVFEYLLCAICPVTLSKPGLGYREDENRIGARIRDWVVGVPDTGFVFPAFDNRSTDIDSTLFYTKDAKEPHTELMELGLGCAAKLTKTVQKLKFEEIIKSTGANDDTVLEIQKCLQEKIECETDDSPVMLNSSDVEEIAESVGVSKGRAENIKMEYEKMFNHELVNAQSLIDEKQIEKNEERMEKEMLQQQVKELKEKVQTLEEEKQGLDVVITVTDEKAKAVREEIIDGRRSVIIPLDENEQVSIVKK